MYIQRSLHGLLLAMVTIGGEACSTGPKVADFPGTASSSEELSVYTSDMHQAVANQVDVLAPSSFQKADQFLKTATQRQENGSDSATVLHSIAEGKARLVHANDRALVVKQNVEEVVIARAAAIVAGGKQLSGNAFDKADERLRTLTSMIEDNDMSGIEKRRGKIQAEYRDIELSAITHSNLSGVRAGIAAAIKEGARKHAQQSLAIAEKKANDTEAFIIANRYSTDEIHVRSEDAMLSADHLLKITRDSKAGKKVSSEENALRLESEQNRTKSQQELIVTERDLAQKAAVESEALKVEQKFNQDFEVARSQFAADEAEVYRKGNQLILRLRSLEFPANQATLRGSNFALLTKVGAVVKGFHNSSVVIEGHTDSDGGKIRNNLLSVNRSQAVLDYLVSSGVITRDRITHVGFGDERPLASNKTEAGKAQNRRVDVIINHSL